MSTLILYDSKRGFTKDCAMTLFENLDDSEIFTIDDNRYNIEQYETILIGAPIYVGELEKEVKDFLKKVQFKIIDKKVGLFCAGMNKSEFNMAVQGSVPAELFYHAQICHCGGRINFSSLTFKEKRTLKKRLGITESQDLLLNEELEHFIQWVKSDTKEKLK